jgi:hypothetical protein
MITGALSDRRTIVATISTGGRHRSDELAYDPVDELVLAVNGSDTLRLSPSFRCRSAGRPTLAPLFSNDNATVFIAQNITNPYVLERRASFQESAHTRFQPLTAQCALPDPGPVQHG